MIVLYKCVSAHSTCCAVACGTEFHGLLASENCGCWIHLTTLVCYVVTRSPTSLLADASLNSSSDDAIVAAGATLEAAVTPALY